MDNKEIVQIKTREIYHLLLVKDIDVVLAHRLLGRVFNVIWYRYKVKTAETPESTSLARWSLEDARDELNSLLYSMNICSLDKVLITFVANHYEYETDGK